MPRATLTAVILSLLLPALARAQDLPPLAPEHAAAVAAGVDPSAAPDNNPGFDALLAHVRTWGDQMRLWSAGNNRPTDSVQLAWLESLADHPDPADLGTDAVLFGRLIERAPTPRRANLERWIIEPLEPGTSDRASRAIVLYIVRPVSVMLQEPEPGWFVRAGARYAGIVELPRTGAPPSDPPGRYPAFIGATYEVSPRAGSLPSSIFVWVGLLLAALLGTFILLVLTVRKARSRGASVLRNRHPLSARDSS